MLFPDPLRCWVSPVVKAPPEVPRSGGLKRSLCLSAGSGRVGLRRGRTQMENRVLSEGRSSPESCLRFRSKSELKPQPELKSL